MSNIFDNYIAMDLFCYDIVEEWIVHRKKNGKRYDEESYLSWLEDDFIGAMECAYKDCMSDRGEYDDVS